MTVIQQRLVSFVLILLACGQSATAGTYSDPSGFSFTYPDDWLTLTRANVGDANRALPEQIKNWMAQNKFDPNKVAVMLVRNGQEDFLENLNVIVTEKQVPVNENAVKNVTEEMRKKFAAAGVTIENIQGRVHQIGGRNVVLFDFQLRIPGVPTHLRQRQVMFPGGGKTYIVTCTASVETFNLHEPTFERILSSFQAPAPVSTSWFDFHQIAKMALVGAIVGGAIAGVGAIIKFFTRTAKPGRPQKSDDDET